MGEEVGPWVGEVDGEGGPSQQFPLWQQFPQYAALVPQWPHWLQHSPSAQGLFAEHLADCARQFGFGVFVLVIVLVVVVTVAPVFTDVEEVVVVVSLS